VTVDRAVLRRRAVLRLVFAHTALPALAALLAWMPGYEQDPVVVLWGWGILLIGYLRATLPSIRFFFSHSEKQLDQVAKALKPVSLRFKVIMAVAAGILVWDVSRRHWQPDLRRESAHYVVLSTASSADTEALLSVAESVHRTYAELLKGGNVPCRSDGVYQLRLYRDREEFKRSHRWIGWGEAFYRYPACHAYIGKDANPWHWMIHEEVHQLNREAADLDLAKWLDEGLACYISTSQRSQSGFVLGTVDRNAYPIWWLDTLGPTGDWEEDVRAGRMIPLEAIVSGDGGPDLSTHFNHYYIHWWSLVHFLLHGEEGRYRAAFFQLLKSGGDRNDFVRLVGSPESLEPQWYAHLRRLATASGKR
jgi:hypothetical protein